MYELTKTMYPKKTISKYYKILNISNEEIAGLRVDKLLQLPAIYLKQFQNNEISKEKLEEKYFRGLESRGQHLISVDYREAILVCGCKTYKHSDECPMPYLKKYMALKKHKIERYV